jgi:hypothetical protein
MVTCATRSHASSTGWPRSHPPPKQAAMPSPPGPIPHHLPCGADISQRCGRDRDAAQHCAGQRGVALRGSRAAAQPISESAALAAARAALPSACRLHAIASAARGLTPAPAAYRPCYHGKGTNGRIAPMRPHMGTRIRAVALRRGGADADCAERRVRQAVGAPLRVGRQPHSVGAA